MILRGDQLIFDIEAAAKAAYDKILNRSRHATWWSAWEDLEPSERDVWQEAVAEALAVYDPEVAGFVIKELRKLWTMIEPVVRPYSGLLLRPDEKSCAKDGDEAGDRIPT